MIEIDIKKLAREARKTEVENIARCLFEIRVSLGQLAAYEEGLDKLFGLSYRAKWENVGEDTQKWWVSQAEKYIKKQGIETKPLLDSVKR